MAEVKPTRSEYLNLKKKIALAKKGHSLLKKKRDGLIIELRKKLRDAKSVRKEMIEKIKEAEKYIEEAQVLEGEFALKYTSLYLKQKPVIELKTKNLMGVSVPQIDYSHEKVKEEEYKKIILTLPHYISKSVMIYEEILKEIINTVELEVTLRNLLKEIESTKRRVNALEYIVLPKLESQISWVKMMLDEAERENTFRLKTVKKKIAREH